MSAFEFMIALVAMAMAYKLIMVALQRRSGAAKASPEDEFELLREIQAGLARMDRRVEALETLLDERHAERKTTSPQ